MKRVTLLTLLLLSLNIWGQSLKPIPADKLLDSALAENDRQHLGAAQNLLKNVAKKIDTNKVNNNSYNYYLISGINYFDSRLIPQSFKFTNRALSMARQLGDSSEVGNVYSQLGNIYVVRADYPTALSYYKKALNRLDSNGAEYYSTKLNMSQAYSGVNQYHEALNTLTAATEYYKKSKNYTDLAVAENNIGEIYRSHINDATKAKLHYRRAIAANKQMQNLQGLAQNYHNMAALFLDLNQPDSAVEPALMSEKLRTEIGDSSSLVFSNYLLGSLYKAKEDYPKAISYYNTSLNLSRKNQLLMGVYHNSIDLGQVYFLLGDYKQSMEYLQQALELAETAGEIKLSETAYTGLYEVSKNKKDYAKAIEYLEKKVQITDSIQTLKAEQNIAELRTKFETDLKEAENSALKTKEKITSQKLELSNRLLFLAALSILILLGAGLVMMKLLKERKRANEKLADQYIKLKEQEEKVQESNDFKNKILSVLGHDLRTPLSAVSTLLNTMSAVQLSKEELQELLPHLSKEVDISLETLQQILAWSRLEMDEMNLKLENLDAKDLLKEIVDTYEVNIRTKALKIDLDVQSGLVINADKNQLRSIISNLLSNAIKFSPTGDTIRINAFQKNDNHPTVVEVIDNGRGISEAVISNLNDRESVMTSKGTSGEKGTGIGLRIAQDFARAHNGQIKFERMNPKGTKASLLIQSVVQEEVEA